MTDLKRRQLLRVVGTGAIAAPFLNLKPAYGAEFTFKYANDLPVTHPVNIWISKACDQIREKTKERVDIKMFPNNQLGSDPDMLNQLRLGGIDFLGFSGLLLATMVPVAAINGVAFAFPTYADVWKAMDGELGAYLRASIEKTGLVVFDKIFDNGYRQITSGTKPINTPADLQGFKIRVPGAALWVSMFKGLGASPTTINFSEVYSALQTKVVDGQETPLVTIESAKLYEVQKYCAMSNHMWDGFYFLANRKSLAKLPEDLQKLVRDTMNAVALQERDDSAKQAVALKSQLEKKGLVFNSTDPAQFRDTLRKAGFYVEWQKTFGPEAWGLLEKTAGKLT